MPPRAQPASAPPHHIAEWQASVDALVQAGVGVDAAAHAWVELVFLFAAEDRGLLPRGASRGEADDPLGPARSLRERLMQSSAIGDRELARFLAGARALGAQEVEQIGHAYESLIERDARRASGVHYTPRALTEALVRRTLDPLAKGRTARALLELIVWDPAVGSGAFLVQVCRDLAARLVHAWSTGRAEGTRLPDSADDRRVLARRLVAERCLLGSDLDPTAVAIAKLCLWLTVGQRDLPFTFLDHAFRVGDSLLEGGDEYGVDAVVGNPPWMAHAKRAAVPISDGRRAALRSRYPGFSAYPTTHGAFLVRAARALRPGGRLGLVLPTSVVDLDGYAGYRAAHDELCVVDPELRSIAEGAFPGVFQPCALVTSTRRAVAAGERDGELGGEPRGRAWLLAREDLSPAARAFLQSVDAREALPPACFRDLGLTSNAANRGAIFAAAESDEGLPLLAGADVAEFRVGAPSYRARAEAWARPRDVVERYARVAVLIRQTARYPIAARSNGSAFRNSVLGGFATPELSAEALCAWLNSWTIRWLHFMRFRDAREGMPQVKISHLRRTPAPPRARTAELEELGTRLHAAPDAASLARLERCVRAALAVPVELEPEIDAWVAARP